MDVLTDEMVIFWGVGVTLSAICFLTQILIYTLVRSSRKLDMKILTQITVARLLNVAFEYLAATMPDFLFGWRLDVVLALYFHSDCVLICWMFLFSKNLYDKLTKVFTAKKITFVWMSVLVWVLTIPIGVLCPLLLYINLDYFEIFYKVYAYVKFFILTVNLLFFCRIFYVAIKRKISGNFKGILKTCVVSFILVSVSSVQVFLTDLVSFFEHDLVMFVFCVINSYQVVVVMAIFVNLVYGFSRKLVQKDKTTNKTINSVSSV